MKRIKFNFNNTKIIERCSPSIFIRDIRKQITHTSIGSDLASWFGIKPQVRNPASGLYSGSKHRKLKQRREMSACVQCVQSLRVSGR